MAETIKYSDDLKATLLECPNISHVHFTAKGDHYFNAYKDDSGNGKLYGRSTIVTTQSTKAGNSPVTTSKKVGIASTEIVKSVAREEILKEKKAA